MNEIVIMGRLTADPELKTFPDGSEYCNFTVAVDREYKDKEGNRPTDFFDCKTTKQGAVFVCKYFKKGDGIALKGSMEQNRTEKDGQKKVFWNLRVHKTEFPPSKKSTGYENTAPDAVDVNPPEFNETDDGDLPF